MRPDQQNTLLPDDVAVPCGEFVKRLNQQAPPDAHRVSFETIEDGFDLGHIRGRRDASGSVYIAEAFLPILLEEVRQMTTAEREAAGTPEVVVLRLPGGSLDRLRALVATAADQAETEVSQGALVAALLELAGAHPPTWDRLMTRLHRQS